MTGSRTAAWMQEYAALATLGLVCVAASLRYGTFLDDGIFLTSSNLLNVLRQNSFIGLVALGMTFVILSGGIDLSVGSIVAVAGVGAAASSAYGVFPALAAGLGLGLACGVLNGVLIARAGLQPFVVTLATMLGVRGLALAFTAEQSTRVAAGADALTWLARGRLGPVPMPVILLAAAYLLAWAVLRYVPFGRYVYAIGDNAEAARLMGLDVGSVTVGVYGLSGLLSGAAGLLLAARLGAGQPVAGAGWELDAIAAVVVGGTLLSGGKGGVDSTLVGVLLLGVIFNIFNLEGTISPWWQGVLRGVFLLVVVLFQNRLQRKAES
jgi:ribose transport system permease protein